MRGTEQELGKDFIRLAPSGAKDGGSANDPIQTAKVLEQHLLQAPPALEYLIRQAMREIPDSEAATPPTEQELQRYAPKVGELHTFSTSLLNEYGSEQYEKLARGEVGVVGLQFREHYFFATPPARVVVDEKVYDVRLVEQGARRAAQ